MHLFERTVGGKYRAPVSVGGLDDPVIRGRLERRRRFTRRVEELEMLEHAGRIVRRRRRAGGQNHAGVFRQRRAIISACNCCSTVF